MEYYLLKTVHKAEEIMTWLMSDEDIYNSQDWYCSLYSNLEKQ